MGKIVTYKQIIRCVGIDKSYFRAIPIYLKKAPTNYPLHRIVDSQGRITSHISEQKELLEAEGVEVLSKANCYSVVLKKHVWEHEAIY